MALTARACKYVLHCLKLTLWTFLNPLTLCDFVVTCHIICFILQVLFHKSSTFNYCYVVTCLRNDIEMYLTNLYATFNVYQFLKNLSYKGLCLLNFQTFRNDGNCLVYLCLQSEWCLFRKIS